VSSPEERTRILSLAQDFPAIWQASTTSNAERKQLLRFLVKDVTLTTEKTTFTWGCAGKLALRAHAPFPVGSGLMKSGAHLKKLSPAFDPSPPIRPTGKSPHNSTLKR
jgi:hypothetical protein